MTNYNLSGGADREAQILREKISNAKDNLKITGKSYYISNGGDDNNDGLSPETAWKTVEKIEQMGDFLEYGDAVLFERESEFRLKSCIICVDGVTYGAYGQGEKPILIGSEINYADETLWLKTNRPNLWVLQLPTKPCEPKRFTGLDVGIVVFDHGNEVGIMKNSIGDISKDFDFAYQKSFNQLYLYYSGGNPGEIFKDIEIGIKRSFFYGMENAHDITIDNICTKYTGEFSVHFICNAKNITVTNCEFGWIGGCHISSTCRFGNAIEFWCSCENIHIENNYIYQIYDAAISPQGEQGMVCDRFNVIGNLVEYSTYSFELFCFDSIGWFKNSEIHDNIMRFAGYGWGNQRPDKDNASHFTSWSYDLSGSYQNFNVYNNIFDCSSEGLVSWHWTTEKADHSGFKIWDNTYYQKPNEKNLAIWYGQNKDITKTKLTATCQAEFEKAIKTLEKEPKKVIWLEN